jgi:hypothetical protein
MIFKLTKGNEVVCGVNLDSNNSIELNSAVFVVGYSKILTKYFDEIPKVVNNFEEIENLYIWLQNIYFNNKKNIYTFEDYNNITNYIRNLLKKIALEYDLSYTEKI